MLKFNSAHLCILFFHYLEMKRVPPLNCAKEGFFLLSLFFGSVQQQQQQQQQILLKVVDVYYHF